MVSAAYEASIAGGGYVDLPQTAAGGDAIILRVKSTTGVNTVSWRCYGTHDSATSVATIQALLDAGLGGSPNGQTCSFTLPAGTEQAYGIECKVNDGKDAEGNSDAAMVAKGGIYVLNPAGARPFFSGETTEENATHGTTGRLNAALAGVSAPAVTAPTDPGEDTRIAVASGGDLIYPTVTVTGSTVDAATRAITTTGVVNGGQLQADAEIVADTSSGDLTVGSASNTGSMLHDVPTGETYSWSVNSVAAMDLSSTQLSLGARNLGMTGYITHGSSPADTGDLRFTHGFSMQGATSGSTTAVRLFSWGIESTNLWQLGRSSHQGIIAGSVLQFQTTSTHFRISSTGLQLGNAADHGGGVVVVGVDNATTEPTTNPSDGAIWWSYTDAPIKARSAAGHITMAAAHGFSGGRTKVHEFRVETSGTTPADTGNIALASGDCGVLSVEIVAFDQAAPSTNRLEASGNLAVNNASGTISVSNSGAPNGPTPTADGAASAWTAVVSDAGSGNIKIALTGSGSLDVTWIVRARLTSGSLA